MSDDDRRARITWGISDLLDHPNLSKPQVRGILEDRMKRPVARGVLFDFALAQMQFNLKMVSTLIVLAGSDEGAKKAALSQALELYDDFQQGIQLRLTSMMTDELYKAAEGEAEA
ncbi:hypothetical protein [Sphingomonas sp. 3-13AW]|uniref:hypothetical protein n=1 Tax=Sphingomonas sp. 3-13AW TaxID=3050450 RepID=UPI003BB76698